MDVYPFSFEPLVTFMACALAGACVLFMGYLAWRRFGPTRRHRHHRSRLNRYVGKS
ncbi:MAG: hypothetical protein ACLQVX_18555 [Limisphaerales bacterium]